MSGLGETASIIKAQCPSSNHQYARLHVAIVTRLFFTFQINAGFFFKKGILSSRKEILKHDFFIILLFKNCVMFTLLIGDALLFPHAKAPMLV